MNMVPRSLVDAVQVWGLVLLLLTLCSQLLLVLANMLASACPPKAEAPSRQFGEEFLFDPKETCVDTGLELSRGEVYEIDLRISENWSDKLIKSDVTGWLDAPWWMYGSTACRRHLLVGWYEPVARIGGDRRDIYRLVAHGIDSESSLDDRGRRRRLVSRVKARKSGRLYLYVNDAVVFGWSGLYENNRGQATVTVRHCTNICGMQREALSSAACSATSP